MCAHLRLQLYPSPLWLDVLVRAALPRLEQGAFLGLGESLEALLSALADMRHLTRPSDAVLMPFLHACLAAAPDNNKVAAFYRLLAAPASAGREGLGNEAHHQQRQQRQQ